MNDYTIFIFGIFCAGMGGELFVRGAVGLAHWVRISPSIIGATVAAFATSSPEVSVSIHAALAGKPQIALGDVLGSNIVNIALILGLALVISGIQSPRENVKQDFPVALLAPLITAILFLDGEISRIDGLLMLSMFFAWLVAEILEARKQRNSPQVATSESRRWLVVLWCIVGLVLLIVSGQLIVAGARAIATTYGVNEFVIGATVVAIGTSAPELATTVAAKLRGHDDIGLGTILGSNIFDSFFIVAVAAIIHPITAVWHELATALSFGVVALLLAYPTQNGFIERRQGIFLLVLYAAYIATILW